MDNLKTFNYYSGVRKLPTFSQALNWHGMMKKPSKIFLSVREQKVRRAIDSDYLREIWGGLMGSIDLDDEVTVMSSCIDSTMPIRYAAIIRRSGGVSAAFAYCQIVKQMQEVQDLSDAYEVRKAMEHAWIEFDNRVQEANEVSEGFGCDDAKSWLTLRDIGEAPDSEELKKKMLAIARLAGRMYDSFGYQRRDQPNKNPEEVVGAAVGGQIDRVLDSELALLADKDTEDSAAMKILESRAIITEMEGKEDKTRGPLVLCIDESASMHDGDVGGAIYSGAAKWSGRNTWAKACAVALTRIAWSENRPVRCVHFGQGTEVQEIPKDDTRALFEMARSFLSGGTSFGIALKRGRVLVADLEADGFEGADIMLITDGEDFDHDSHDREIDYMDRDGIKLWTIAIGEDLDSNAPVRKRSEKYTYAADRVLTSKDTAVNLAKGFDKAAMGNGSSGMLN